MLIDEIKRQNKPYGLYFLTGHRRFHDNGAVAGCRRTRSCR